MRSQGQRAAPMPSPMRWPVSPQDLPALLAEIVQRIRSVREPERIILFGSYARGQAGPDSDVDIMIVVPETVGLRSQAVDYMAALRRLGVPVEVVVASTQDLAEYGDSPWLIYRSAAKEGVVLYGRAA